MTAILSSFSLRSMGLQSKRLRAGLISLILLATAPLALAQPAHSPDDGHNHSHDAPAADTEFAFIEAPDDHVIGAEDADHTLIMYASNVCPHCGNWFTNDWPKVKSELVETGILRFVLRPVPSHPARLSEALFLMAECAPDEDYFDVMELQFTRQMAILNAPSQDAASLEVEAIARKAGVNGQAEMAECLNDMNHRRSLQTSVMRANGAGITGLPGFVFNGQTMNGDHDANAVIGWTEGRSSTR